jgi:hypothetical protein
MQKFNKYVGTVFLQLTQTRKARNVIDFTLNKKYE